MGQCLIDFAYQNNFGYIAMKYFRRKSFGFSERVQNMRSEIKKIKESNRRCYIILGVIMIIVFLIVVI